MNDPHVVALIYRINHGDTVNYDNAAPLCLKNQNVNDCRFDLIVENKEVQFKFKTHYATPSEARAAIEEYIHNWEFDACLDRNNPDYFRLKFDRPEMEDRNPTPGVITVNAGPICWEFNVSSPSVTHSPASYPLPPSDVSLDSHVELMYQRYMDYLRGRRSLLGMAQFCLTVLEDSGPTPGQQRKLTTSQKRECAAKKYEMEEDDLKKLGSICANTGGREGARKVDGVARPLNESEHHLVKQAVKEMIRRVAQRARDPHKKLLKLRLKLLKIT